MNNNELIDILSKLHLEEASLKRNLDIKYCDEKTRTKLFKRLKEIKKEIEKINFKLRVKKEIKNEKSREDV